MLSCSAVWAARGIVASSQPLAVSTGLQILQSGGSFVDASIATSAVLCVVEPWASQLGGDAFVVLYDARQRKTIALNGSGAAPQRATRELFPNGIPLRGLSNGSRTGRRLVPTACPLWALAVHLPSPPIYTGLLLGFAEGTWCQRQQPPLQLFGLLVPDRTPGDILVNPLAIPGGVVGEVLGIAVGVPGSGFGSHGGPGSNPSGIPGGFVCGLQGLRVEEGQVVIDIGGAETPAFRP
ncbi:MAG: hypothetical protein C4336_03050, partial [Armatimonadota bacterium]